MPPQPATKTVGKILRPTKPAGDSSGAAADDALAAIFCTRRSRRTEKAGKKVLRRLARPAPPAVEGRLRRKVLSLYHP